MFCVVINVIVTEEYVLYEAVVGITEYLTL